MSTADKRWRGNALYFMNVTVQRGGGGGEEREPWMLNSVRVYLNLTVCKVKSFLDILIQNS